MKTKDDTVPVVEWLNYADPELRRTLQTHFEAVSGADFGICVTCEPYTLPNWSIYNAWGIARYASMLIQVHGWQSLDIEDVAERLRAHVIDVGRTEKTRGYFSARDRSIPPVNMSLIRSSAIHEIETESGKDQNAPSPDLECL